MDEALKVRNLGSATARRQRIQERQRLQELASQQRHERRLLLMTPDYASDASAEDSDVQSTSSADDAETPSEYSLRTPEDILSPEVDQLQLHTHWDPAALLPQVQLVSLSGKSEEDTGILRQRPISLVKPIMLASLTTTSDFNYDRFSILVDPARMAEQYEPSSDEEDCTYSPIEIAKPIIYSTPKVRPSMVSIPSYGSQYSMRTPTLTKTTPSQATTPQRFPSSRSVTSQVSEGFMASEAMPMDMSPRPRLHSPASSYGSSSRGSMIDGINVPKRKSSMPLLFGMKSSHSRISSIKNFMRSSTHGPSQSTSQLGDIREEKPKQSLSDERPRPRRSITEPIHIQMQTGQGRPQTARAPAKEFLEEEISTPLMADLPTSPTESNRSVSSPEEALFTQQKSFTKMRQRRGSIGQALKLNFGSKSSTEARPPVPVLRFPSSVSTNDLAMSSAPSPSISRETRRSMAGYSPFPSNENRYSNFGLGLRRVEGV